MNLESIQILFFTTVIFALATLILLPTAALALSRLPTEASAKSSDAGDGAACDLPPYVEIEEREDKTYSDGLPPLDRENTRDYKTATFAMG